MVRATAGLPFILEKDIEVHVVPPPLECERELIVERIEGAPEEAVVYFQGVTNVDSAKQYVGCHCLMRADEVQHAKKRLSSSSGCSLISQTLNAIDLGEGEELHAWQVHDEECGHVGRVLDIQEMPGQVMMVVETLPDKKEVLIPLVEDFIVDVDEASRIILMSLPQGLLEL